MKKKAAICISGHMREYHLLLDDFRNNIINCNPNWEFDIFISTWDIVSSSVSHAFERRNYVNLNKVNIENIKKQFNPIKLEVEVNDDEMFSFVDHMKGTNNIRATFSQFYKVQKVGYLMLQHAEKEKIDYRCVIRMRPDICFINEIILDNYDFDFINLESENFGAWVQDKILLTNLQNYKIYINFFDNIERLYYKIGNNIPEVLLYHYFTELNLKFTKLDNLWVKNTSKIRC
jgi:hypothetical protein